MSDVYVNHKDAIKKFSKVILTDLNLNIDWKNWLLQKHYSLGRYDVY